MVLRPGSNLAVLAACPPPDTDWPMPSASDDEKASIRNIWGLWRSRPCLVSSLHITPDEVMAMSVERSQRPSLASLNRKSVVEGKRVSVRVDMGCFLNNNKKKT